MAKTRKQANVDLGDIALEDDGLTLQPEDALGGLSLADDEAIPADAGGFDGVNVEEEAQAEISEALRAFRKDAERASERMLDNTDSGFYICMGFPTRAHKDEFLRKSGIDQAGDRYLDGMEVARILGIRMETPVPAMPNFHMDATLRGMAVQPGEDYPAGPALPPAVIED